MGFFLLYVKVNQVENKQSSALNQVSRVCFVFVFLLFGLYARE